MTKAILISIKMRALETSPHYADLEHNLSEYKKLLKNIIRLAKTKYYAGQFDNNKANSRHVWATIKYILNRNKSKKESPSYFTLREAIIKEPLFCRLSFQWIFRRRWTSPVALNSKHWN